MPYDILCTFDDLIPDSKSLENFEYDVIVRTLNQRGYSHEQLEVSVLFTDRERIRELNKEYRGKDSPTNVLSFPNDGDNILGDIVLCYDIVKQEAIDQGKDFYDHLTHLTVHSILHLLGYDHISEQEAEEMESIEIKILYNEFGIKNPYL